MTSYERTGWRDQAISERHRLWGIQCPAVDVDFLLIEYDFGKPVALVDYKHYMAAPVDVNSASMRAIRQLADLADCYAMVVRYWPDTWAVEVVPLNERSMRTYTSNWRLLSEQQYVSTLYYLRGKTASRRIKRALNTEKPPIDRAA